MSDDPTANRDPLDPEQWQRYMEEPLPDDDLPIGLPVFRASKCGAICRAAAEGHDGFRPALLDVSRLLSAYAFNTGPIADAVRHTPGGPSDVEAMWRRVDAWPWPTPGPPKDQPD